MNKFDSYMYAIFYDTVHGFTFNFMFHFIEAVGSAEVNFNDSDPRRFGV